MKIIDLEKSKGKEAFHLWMNTPNPMVTFVLCSSGGLHSAKVLLYSVDFAEIEEYQANAEWKKSGKVLADF